MHVFKRIVLFSAVMLASTSVFARDKLDDLVERMNPPKSIEDPRNAICAKDDRGFLKYTMGLPQKKPEKMSVELALYKWGRLHFPNAKDVQTCPKLHYGQLTLRWRDAHEIYPASTIWDEAAMDVFNRLVEGGK